MLNNTLMVGPTIHSQILDVLLRFRSHRVTLTADVSKMYRAVELAPLDITRFVWRSHPNDKLLDLQMTRATFGVSASCFAANMAIKRNAMDLADKYPLAPEAVQEAFYVDDGLTGADDIKTAIRLREQLQDIFSCGAVELSR